MIVLDGVLYLLLGNKLVSGASSVMDMSRNFASSLMSPVGGSLGSLGRGASLSDLHSSLASVPEDSKMGISMVRRELSVEMVLFIYLQSLDKLIKDLEPVCLAEETFCSEFFHFPKVEQQLEVAKQDEQDEVHGQCGVSLMWCGAGLVG